MRPGTKVKLHHAPLGFSKEGVIVSSGRCDWPGCKLGDDCTEIRVTSLRTKTTTVINRRPNQFEIIEEQS